MKTLTSVEAQNRFGELLDTAQREPVTITRRGRAVAFLVSPADMQELIEGRDRRAAAVKAYDAYRARVAGKVSAVEGRLIEEAFHVRGEAAFRQFQRDGVARPVGKVLTELRGKLQAKRKQLKGKP